MPGIGNRLNRFGQEVLVLHRHDRVVYTHHRADLVHPIATCVDHDFTGDVAFFGVYDPAFVGPLGQAGHRRVAIDLCASLRRRASA